MHEQNLKLHIEQLNVLANDIDQQINHDPEYLEPLIKKLSQSQKINIAVIDSKDSVVFQTHPIKSGPLMYGLSLDRGVVYYCVPVTKSGINYKKIILYGPMDLFDINFQNQNYLLVWILGFAVIALCAAMWIQHYYYRNFKVRLSILADKADREIIDVVNRQDLYRFLIHKFSENERALQKQAYSHSLAHARLDERMRNMMHDMKTPIAALHAFVEAYHDGLYQDHMLPKKMSLVAVNVNHLLHLTKQYDEFSKYNSSQTKINMRKIPMETLVSDVIMATERNFVQMGRTIQLVVMESPCSIICDVMELKKMMDVLVENAHKYSEEDKPIVLSATIVQKMLHLSVKDYGIGIDESEQQSIFDPFVKVDRVRGASAQSYGIGLYIAKQIAHKHGGDLVLESSLGKGALFTVVLPIVEDSHVPAS